MSWGRRLFFSALAGWICLGANSAGVLAMDNGQYSNVPEHIRAWFKSVKSPHGVPCCDVSDGHRTDFDIREDAYWVQIDGAWMPVPKEAVVENAGNPTGDAVV